MYDVADDDQVVRGRVGLHDAALERGVGGQQNGDATRAALGALTWQQRAAGELHRALPGRGDNSLTPTEAAIAGLAANGHTNQEIAHQLVVSIKTVEANLTKIYAKLGVRSRTALAPLSPASI